MNNVDSMDVTYSMMDGKDDMDSLDNMDWIILTV